MIRNTIDRAELIASRAVFLLLRDGFEIGEVVSGRHGDAAGPEAAKAAVVVQQGVVFGVDIDEIEGSGRGGDRAEDVAEEAAEEFGLEGVKEIGEGGFGG